jgi:hypothetical protein
MLDHGYFFAHLFEADSHMPPAFSQSAFVVYCEKSAALPDGLAEGEEVELPDPPVVELPEVPEPVPPVVPDGLPAPEVPDVPLPLPVPLLDWAAAIAGAKAMIPTKNVNISFCMCVLPLSNLPAGLFLRPLLSTAIFAPSTASRKARQIRDNGRGAESAR